MSRSPGDTPATGYTVVIPTVGRPQLESCLSALASASGPLPERVVVVDDRPDGPAAGAWPLHVGAPPRIAESLEVRRSGGRGPAGARNVGWARAATPWVVFLDDDVLVTSSWRADLARDLAAADVPAGVRGRIEVPLPRERRPTDWERGTAGLASARWITADMAYRRDVLVRVGGFDERFRRAYREDADLAARVSSAGYRLARGNRRTVHPVRPAGWWASVRAQAGNADDALMRALHGRGWRERAGVPPGRRPRHLAVTTAACAGLGLAVCGQRRGALVAASAWAAGTAEFAAARIRPGPGGVRETARMVATSVAIPAVATYHWLRGLARHSGAAPWWELSPWTDAPRAVLFDRDGTLVHDVPYNGDPRRVRPVPGATEVLDRLRAAGVAVGVVSNQSGVARGLLTRGQVEAVNRRVEEVLGPFGTWAWCAHAAGDGCACRKPAPGLVLSAATALGVAPHECLVVGDTGSDVAAARAAGARCVLVPNAATRRRELRGVRIVPTLAEAVRTALPDVPDAGERSPGAAMRPAVPSRTVGGAA